MKLSEPGRTLAPRRMAWLLLEESLGLRRIDGDWVLRTTCGSERCVNPRRMEPVHKPHRDLDDTSCARGHEMAEENGYRAPDGTWVCRPCKREHMRRYREDTGFRAAQAASTRRYMERHPEQAERKRAPEQAALPRGPGVPGADAGQRQSEGRPREGGEAARAAGAGMTAMTTEALCFLRVAEAPRPADRPFWSTIDEAVDAKGCVHWFRSERIRRHQGMVPRHWARLDLQEGLGLPPLAAEDARWARCRQRRCVDPRRMLAGPSATGLPPARPDLVQDDARRASIGAETVEDGVEHWLWQGDRFDSPERWAWSRLSGELGLDRLRSYGCVRRECAREGCLRPEHQTTRQPMPRARRRRFTALLANLPPVVIPGSRPEAFPESAAAEEEEQSKASLRALRYRTDPDFRAQVRAELRAQARARTEHSRISQKRRARAGRTRTTSKETIDG